MTSRDSLPVRMADLVADLHAEIDRLAMVLPAAIDAQWTAAPTSRPREDTAERAKNEASDPTAAIALDDARLFLRHQVVRSAHVLARGIAAVRDVRMGVERALSPWYGEG